MSVRAHVKLVCLYAGLGARESFVPEVVFA